MKLAKEILLNVIYIFIIYGWLAAPIFRSDLEKILWLIIAIFATLGWLGLTNVGKWCYKKFNEIIGEN